MGPRPSYLSLVIVSEFHVTTPGGLREYIFPLNQVGPGLLPPLKLFFQSCSRNPEFRMGLYDTTIGARNEVLDLWNEFH